MPNTTPVQEQVGVEVAQVENYAVADVVSMIVADSAVAPLQYLGETTVPFGGE